MTTWRRFAAVSVAIIGTIALVIPAQAQATQAHPVSIAHARGLPVGTVVTVEGTATTPSGAFESSFFDKGFAVQDLTAGIYVSVAENPGIAVRDHVRVTGRLQDSFGLLILVPTDLSMITVRGRDLVALPTFRRTGQVNEASEGKLVLVTARITQAPASDLPFGFKFFVNDGSGELTIFVNTQTGIDLSGLRVGQTVVVVGFSSQFDTHYEIDPRFQPDIIALG
jgi:hypothetical protein